MRPAAAAVVYAETVGRPDNCRSQSHYAPASLSDMDDRIGAARGPRAQRLVSRRSAGAATLVGGMLWVLYGFFTMLTPWGADVVYREAQGYSVVVHQGLFVLYNLPGGLALVLTSWGLMQVIAHLRQRSERIDKVTRGLAFGALCLGFASVVAVIAQFDPLFTAARIFGTLSLGVATTMAGVMAHKVGADRSWVAVLTLTGLLGMFLLPLWPLVYALAFVTAWAAAFIIALFGAGWLAVAYLLWRRSEARSTLI